MYHKALSVFTALIVVTLLFSWAAMPAVARTVFTGPKDPDQPRPSLTETWMDAPAAPDITFGAPGTVYSFQARFGTAKEAYIEDLNHFVYPFAVSARGSNIWIADSDGNRVLKYSSTGSYLQQIGQAGYRESQVEHEISLSWLTDVVEDPSGRVWIVDGGSNHVSVFNAAGQFQFTIGIPWEGGSDDAHLSSPRGVAFDSAGNAYIADRGNHRIQVFSSNGVYVASLGAFGTGNYQFNRPHHPAIDGNNLLYVADAINNRVQIFNISNPLTITYLASIGVAQSCESMNTHLCYPTGVDVNNDYIYIADAGNDRIQIFNRIDRGYVATIGPGYGTGNTEFRDIGDVAVDSAGNIYVADQSNHRVQMYNSSRDYVRTFGTTGVPYLTNNDHFNTPTGVAIGADNAIYVTEERGHRLVKLTSDGNLLWSVGEVGVMGGGTDHLYSPGDVFVDTFGRVLVADCGNNRIQIFSTAGQYLGTIGADENDVNDDLSWPTGVAVDSSGRIYVSDQANHRVQVYNPNGQYIATIGQTGVSGMGNNQFNEPSDVAVDSTGKIYVADLYNHRVQVYNRDFVYLRTIGVTGSSGSSFHLLRNPTSVAVDNSGRVFVSPNWGNFINVYDNSGNFLTRINGDWTGENIGQFRQIEGMGFDAQGNLYAAESLNHLIEKWTPGVQNWGQINISGFGNDRAWGAWSLAGFQNTLYAGIYASGIGAQIHRLRDGVWEAVMTGGFGDLNNTAVESMVEFNGHLYAGTINESAYPDTNGAQIWRSSTGEVGSWSQVVTNGFNDPVNGEITTLMVFNNTIYAGTWSWDMSAHGAEVWRSPTGDPGSWTKVFDDTVAGHDKNAAIVSMDIFDAKLLIGTWNPDTGGEIYSSSNGDDWTQVNIDGFGSSDNTGILSLEVFNGRLYAGVRNSVTGGQIWSTDNGTTWNPVNDNGFGSPVNTRAVLIAYNQQLYAFVSNNLNGVQLWHSASGGPGTWTLLNDYSFGAGISQNLYFEWPMTVVDNHLYIGTSSTSNNGARIYVLTDRKLYLPLMQR